MAHSEQKLRLKKIMEQHIRDTNNLLNNLLENQFKGDLKKVSEPVKSPVNKTQAEEKCPVTPNGSGRGSCMNCLEWLENCTCKSKETTYQVEEKCDCLCHKKNYVEDECCLDCEDQECSHSYPKPSLPTTQECKCPTKHCKHYESDFERYFKDKECDHARQEEYKDLVRCVDCMESLEAKPQQKKIEKIKREDLIQGNGQAISALLIKVDEIITYLNNLNSK